MNYVVRCWFNRYWCKLWWSMMHIIICWSNSFLCNHIDHVINLAPWIHGTRSWCMVRNPKVVPSWDASDDSTMAVFHSYVNVYQRVRMDSYCLSMFSIHLVSLCLFDFFLLEISWFAWSLSLSLSLPFVLNVSKCVFFLFVCYLFWKLDFMVAWNVACVKSKSNPHG